MYIVCILINQLQPMKPVTTSIIHDTRIRKNDGTYAVKIRVTHNRVQKYFPINFHLSKEDWKKTQMSRPRGIFKELKLKFNAIESKAIQIIAKLHPFTFEKFHNELYQEHKNSDLIGALELYKDNLKAENREGSADTFKCAISSFKKYLATVKKEKLLLNELTPTFLSSYEKWMIKKGTSLNTIGIYLRNVRTAFNKAIADGVIDAGSYPFGKGKYMIPRETKAKTALSRQDLKLLFEYTPQNEMEEWSRDLWLFSYLCNGMNLKDIAKLQYKNIDWENSRLTFLRTKTSRSRKHNTKQIIVPLIGQALAILKRWSKSPQKPNNFVFGIISHKDKEEDFLKKTRQAIKTINKYLKRVGENAGIKVPLTSNIARHTYATIMLQNGAAVELIKEGMGHGDIRTTQIYLGSFEDKVKMDFQNKLIEF